jgi:hypothetical protein
MICTCRAATPVLKEAAVRDRPTITIELTKEQRLEILAATGLYVKILEVPIEVLEESVEALARHPVPEWVKQLAASAEGAE